jgi:hypothetical protein
MLIKGSQRGGAQDLAKHLLRTDENEHVHVFEVRGFVSDDLRGAFREAEAVARGTKCRQHLFSCSFSPPESSKLSTAQFLSAIDRTEEALGLEGQPRAVVFHEKQGRRHAHCVWSRIDAEQMKAKQLSHFKLKLRDVSRALHVEFGIEMPRGLQNSSDRNPLNYSLAEYYQAKRNGVDARWIKQTIQDAWNISDNRASTARALEERGLILARGDKRGFVAVDYNGEVYALARSLGLKSKAVGERLGDPSQMRSVEEAGQLVAQRMTERIRSYIGESRAAFQKDAATLGHEKMEMTHLHRSQRADLAQRQKEHADREAIERQARLPRGLFRNILDRITGRYATIKKQNETEAKDSAERREAARQDLIDAQREERRALQVRIQQQRDRQAEQLRELRRDVGRYFGLAHTSEARRGLDRTNERVRVRERSLEP